LGKILGKSGREKQHTFHVKYLSLGKVSIICEPISVNMREQKLTKEMITYRFDVVWHNNPVT